MTKEALDSLDGLDDPRAWRLREAFVSRWPATVVSSLEGLPLTERAEALVLRALELTSGRLPVLRNAYRLVATSHWPRSPRSAPHNGWPGTKPRGRRSESKGRGMDWTFSGLAP